MRMNYEIYQQGVDARHEQKAMLDNPYPDGTDKHYDWHEGYTDMDEAMFRNPERFVK